MRFDVQRYRLQPYDTSVERSSYQSRCVVTCTGGVTASGRGDLRLTAITAEYERVNHQSPFTHASPYHTGHQSPFRLVNSSSSPFTASAFPTHGYPRHVARNFTQLRARTRLPVSPVWPRVLHRYIGTM
eukprot:4807364-Prymnesium_polylepis.2